MAWYRCGGGNGKIKINNSEEVEYNALFGDVESNNFVEIPTIVQNIINNGSDGKGNLFILQQAKLDDNKVAIFFGFSTEKYVYIMIYNPSTNEILLNPTLFRNGYGWYGFNACVLGTNKILITHACTTSSNYTSAEVCTFVGTSFTFGTEVQLHTSYMGYYYGFCALDNGIVFVGGSNTDNDYFVYGLLSISGNTITILKAFTCTYTSHGWNKTVPPKILKLGSNKGVIIGCSGSSYYMACGFTFEVNGTTVSYSDSYFSLGSRMALNYDYCLSKIDNDSFALFGIGQPSGSYWLPSIVKVNVNWSSKTISTGAYLIISTSPNTSYKEQAGIMEYANGYAYVVTYVYSERKFKLYKVQVDSESTVISSDYIGQAEKLSYINGLSMPTTTMQYVYIIDNKIMWATTYVGTGGMQLLTIPLEKGVLLSKSDIFGLLTSKATKTTKGKVLKLEEN